MASSILEWLRERHWLPVAVAAIAYLTSLTSDWSRFPVEVPDRWKPVVAVVLGQAYAVLVSACDGVPWEVAARHGVETAFVAMGLFDLVAKAAFGDVLPPWAAWLKKLAFERRPEVPPFPPPIP